MGARRRIIWLLAFLAAMHASVLLAGFLAPYPYAEQHRDYPYAAPTRIHFDGLRPCVYRMTREPGFGRYTEDASRIFPVHFFKAGRLFGVEEPGAIFLLGTDGYGRDVFSRLLYGGRVSLLTGLLATFLALALGASLGTLAGFFGGWTDQILTRGGELFLALPWFYLLLGIRAFLPLHITTAQTFVLLAAIIGGVGWARPSRLIRGVVLSAKEREFVQAARGFGGSSLYLIRRHILPLTAQVAITQATVLIPQYVLAEVTLSFLGLGIGEPVPSWGNMLAEARQYHSLLAHPWMLAPGIAIIPVTLGYLLLADRLLEQDQDFGTSHI
jgi:peptide/nickel transport system permease protein